MLNSITTWKRYLKDSLIVFFNLTNNCCFNLAFVLKYINVENYFFVTKKKL